MGSSSNTVEKESELDKQRAKFASLIGPHIMDYLMQGMGGVPSSQQTQANLNVNNQLRYNLGRMGVNPGDPRMFEMFRKNTEGMTKPSSDIMSAALSLYAGTPGTGGGSQTTSNAGLMGTMQGIGSLGAAGLAAYGIGKAAGLWGGTTALAAAAPVAMASSIDLKQDIEPLASEDCLKKVCSLRSVGYRWKHNAEPDAGLIAEELMEVIPEAGAMVGGYNGIKPLTVIGYLVESIKQLNNELKALKAQDGGDK